MEPLPKKFNPKNVDKYFSNVSVIEDDRFPVYSVKDNYGTESGIITYLGKSEWRVYVDNFPSQKKYFACNYPVHTLDQFIADVSRTGLKLNALGGKSTARGEAQ